MRLKISGKHHQSTNWPARLMKKLFGNEWWHSADDATETNPDYEYLERIILAVQQSLRQEHPQQEAA